MQNFKNNAFNVILGAVFILFCLYTLFIASSRFEATSQFIIKSQELQTTDLIGGLTGLPSNDTHQEGEILIAYLKSADALNAINKTLDLSKHFNCRRADFISCLPINASLEDKLKNWNNRVEPHLDNSNGIIEIKSQGFSPQDALKLNESLAQISNSFINNYNQQIMQDALQIAMHELSSAEKKLQDKEVQLSVLQEEQESPDPMASSQSKLVIIAEIEGQLAQAQTELSTLRSYMRESAPAVIAQRQKTNAITRQLERQNELLLEENMGAKEGSTSKAEYEKLALDKELAQKAYAAAISALEIARFETKKQQRYLIQISKAQLPEEATYPYRWTNILKFLIALMLITAIGKLIILTIKDHIGWT